MEILSSIIGLLFEYTIKPIGRELNYVCFIHRNIQNLKSRVEMLKDTKETVQHKVSEARTNAENIKSGVQNWLTKVDTIIEKSEGILVNHQAQQATLCSLNFVQRHQLSKAAVKLADEILEINNEGNFDRVSYNVALSEIESSKARTPDFIDFESRKSTLEKIIAALMDDDVKRIGVYGMGGVGKTMLVKEISRIVMEKKLFDVVITSTISQTPHLKRIQGQLGDKLGLKFEQETEQGRALKLQKRLKMEQRIFVVLDDVWNQIDLETIGIPCIVDHPGCKLLFTSRDNSIFFNDMCTDENFEIKVLEEDETWSLFKKIAGDIVETPNLRVIAAQIARECAHLPIAITTIAKALRNKRPSIWKDALNQLRNPVVLNIRGMNEKVYSLIELSYKQLECKEAKLLFLLCSMFPEDYLINVGVLHIYAMGMGFLHGVDNVGQARDRITKLVDDLIASSLLLEEPSEWNTCVKMHDIVRDVAILIAAKDDRVRTLSYSKGLNESWQEKKIMSGDLTAVYFNFEGLHKPPQKLMLPKVQLLVLHGPYLDGHELPTTFFEEMKELKVLELYDMRISLQTSMICSFANLQALHLFFCELGCIDMIDKLNSLEILSFRGSNIIQIPLALSQLKRLKVLDLSSCHQLKVIPPNVLLNLTKLEELNLETFSGWEGGELNEGRRNASLSELSYLSQLCYLVLQIEDEKIVPRQLLSRWLNLEKFDISIGCENLSCCPKEISRMLMLKMESGSFVDNEINMLLKKSEELHLEGSIGSRVLHFELNENDSSHLKNLYIHDNSEFQHVIHEQNKALKIFLSNLELLEFSNLQNLETIYDGHVTESPFNKLKVIRLFGCNKLENVFFNYEMSNKKIEFTNLASLELKRLPRLESFCLKIEKLQQQSLDNLEKGETSRFSNDGSFFSEQVSLPNLEQLQIKKAHNLKMICHNSLIPNSFSKLKSIKIGNCNNLQKVFSSNIMSRLTCLQILKIKSCNVLEGVFEMQEPNVTKKNIDLLPNLRHLELADLPNLRYIWEKDPLELLNVKNMKILSIHQCPKLKREYPAKVLQQLKELEIDVWGLKEILKKEKSVQMLGHDDQFETSKVEITQLRDGRELFFKLKTLTLCGSLDYQLTHLPTEMIHILQNLEYFEVRKTLFEEVFPIEKFIDVDQEPQNERFKLSSLQLYDMPKLRHLWNEDSQKNASILQNLDSLLVVRCGILNMSVSSSLSFTNLTELTVHKCHKLTYLLTPSVVRSLVKLESLILEGCKRMSTVIVGGAEDQENDELIFNRLDCLDLADFSQLISFYSGKCIIRFPRLNNIFIENCPEMRCFSLGTVSTPCLPTDHIGYYDHANKWCPLLKNSKEIIVEDINVIVRQAWNDNCDANIQYLFEDQNLEENQSDRFSSLQYMLKN